MAPMSKRTGTSEGIRLSAISTYTEGFGPLKISIPRGGLGSSRLEPIPRHQARARLHWKPDNQTVESISLQGQEFQFVASGSSQVPLNDVGKSKKWSIIEQAG